jgi:uncharacterized protein involved in exopolysaccharide biosynthesis
MRDPDLDVPDYAPESSGVPVLTALRRHWLLVLVPLVVLTGLAVAAGVGREPEYTAKSLLSVGRVDASVGGLAGFTAASQSLSETYSRSVKSDAVIVEAAKKTNLSEAEVRGAIKARPVPQTPVFRVEAEASSARRAVAISVAVADALAAEANRRSRGSSNEGRILREYQAAAEVLEERESAASRAAEREARSGTASNVAALNRARAAAAAAKVRTDALREAYEQATQGKGAVALVDVIEPARGASSDRNRILQLLVFIGVVAGLAIGVGLALLRANRGAHGHAANR